MPWRKHPAVLWFMNDSWTTDASFAGRNYRLIVQQKGPDWYEWYAYLEYAVGAREVAHGTTSTLSEAQGSARHGAAKDARTRARVLGG